MLVFVSVGCAAVPDIAEFLSDDSDTETSRFRLRDGTWEIHSPANLRTSLLKPSEIWDLSNISNTPKNKFFKILSFGDPLTRIPAIAN